MSSQLIAVNMLIPSMKSINQGAHLSRRPPMKASINEGVCAYLGPQQLEGEAGEF
jgi:hypothetical protein